MKIYKKIFLVSLLAQFFIGLIILLLSFITIQKYANQAFDKRCLEIAEDLATFIRPLVLSGNANMVYNYVEQIAPDRKISFFELKIPGIETDFKRPISSVRTLNRVAYFSKDLFFDVEAKEKAGNFVIGFSSASILELRNNHILMFLCFLLISVLCTSIVLFTTNKKISLTHNSLVDYFYALLENPNQSTPIELEDFKQIVDKARQLSQKYHDSQEALRRSEESAILGQIASQVSHDIRSPLAALTLIEKNAKDLPEELRIMLREATTRIRNIANNLLEKQNKPNTSYNQSQNTTFNALSNALSSEPCSVEAVFTIINQILDEKHLQFQHYANLRIENTSTEGAYALFANIQPTELKRIVSNLINNASEALEPQKQGHITVNLSSEGNKTLSIIVQDNGKGISQEVLPKLTSRGATFGKAGGSGLGLYHAKTTVEAWGGSLNIESTINHGTMIKLNLPQVCAPQWFIKTLQIHPKHNVIVLDDDPSIHSVWNHRFSPIRFSNKSTTLMHFSKPQELEEWVATHLEEKSKALYLVDFELRNEHKNGLDVIESLEIQKHSILVSSQFDDLAIRNRCETLGIKIIPKNLSAIIPITINA